ncbi:vacuolar ATP synthase subunit [Babesia ovis]|uniref:Vacuolar ATP synthase subunit n=1 Tax=Babesia ovis TaxID=5869 RepID=A0A9W5WTH9_BABOV|nr:vacuolar ATP synthase subunit [Babesia ovis]
MSNAKGSNALIQQLLKAEEEAEAIVKRARENRVKLLNEAISAAENDLKVFSETEEKRLLEEYHQLLCANPSTPTFGRALPGDTLHKDAVSILTSSQEHGENEPQLDELDSKAKERIKKYDERFRECKDRLVNKLVAATIDVDVTVPDSFRYYVKQNSP